VAKDVIIKKWLKGLRQLKPYEVEDCLWIYKQ